jgi:hypothetical protein
MKIPKPILLYLLALEMLPLLDRLLPENKKGFLKSIRTIEKFTHEIFQTIESHAKLANIVNDELVQQFSNYIDDLKYKDEELLYCISGLISDLCKDLKSTMSFYKAICSFFNLAIHISVYNGIENGLKERNDKFKIYIDNIEIQELKK